MADTARRAAPALDPVKELQALELLKASIADACRDDPDLLLDMAEGETSIMEVLDRLLEGDLVDQGLQEGLAKASDIIKLRAERFDMRIKTRRALIEQAMMLLEIKKLERPTATVTMANRAPTIEVEDESAVPSAYFKSKLSLDKKALNDAYKELLARQEAEIATAKAEGREPEFFPMIEGCRVTNGTVSLSVRRR